MFGIEFTTDGKSGALTDAASQSLVISSAVENHDCMLPTASSGARYFVTQGVKLP